jgi:hypothetical protein
VGSSRRAPTALPPGRSPVAPRTEGRVSARTGLNEYGEKKISYPTDFKQQTGQPMAIRYAEYVILSPAFKRMHLHFSGESAFSFIQ